jgi:hypothetical protein
MGARGLANRLVTWQARGGIDDLNDWELGEKPEDIYGGKTASELSMSTDPAMWKSVPQVFTLAVDPYGTEKRFYFGKAMIAITEDGSIVLQDAQGGQFMLSGGNAYVSVPHDIIQVAGRNLMQVSGRDMALRSSRHLDASSQEGRVMVSAADQLALSGGHNGNSGVLIESKGQHGYSQGGENPNNSAGVIIKTNQLIGLKAANITLSTKNMGGWSSHQGGGGLIMLDAGNTVMWRAYNNRRDYAEQVEAPYWGAFGATISAKLAGASVVLGRHSVIPSLTVPNRLTYGKLLHLITPRVTDDPNLPRTAPDWPFRGDDLLDGVTELMDYYNSVESNPLYLAEQAFGDEGTFNAKWLSSQQYTIDEAPAFYLPEPDWQSRMREVADPESVVLTSTMRDQPIEDTSPFPGAEVWAEQERLIRININSPDWGESSEEEPSIEYTTIEGNLLKGL